jgi:membrane protein DedA with SNARE-associated domain
MDALLQWLAQYEYVGLFGALALGILGLPIPDETLLVLFGYLISQGKLHPLGTYLTGLAGSMCGISLSYTLGRTLGHGFIHRWGPYIHVTEARLARVHKWFDRIGHWLLTIGYYIPGVRHFTALVAGTSGMSFRNFALYAYSGAAIWVASFLGLGYVLGENWSSVFEVIHRRLTAFTVVSFVVGLLLWWWYSKREDA